MLIPSVYFDLSSYGLEDDEEVVVIFDMITILILHIRG